MLNAVRLRIDLAYDGTGFYGWAKQPEIRTVQGEIERVLHTILRVPEGDPTEPLRLTVAGRTDTGVHASHQVCHLDVNEDVLKRCVGHMDVPPVIALTRRLQRMLPADIAIRGIAPAPDGFDARFSALERTYVYRIADRSSEVDPRTRNFVLHIDDELDLKSMNEAAAMTIGLHDFGSFATPNPGGTTIREVKTAYWRRVPQRTLIDGGMTMGGAVPYADRGIGPRLLRDRRRRVCTQYGALPRQRLRAGRYRQTFPRLVCRKNGGSAARRLHRTDRAARTDAGAYRISGRRPAGGPRRSHSRQAHTVALLRLSQPGYGRLSCPLPRHCRNRPFRFPETLVR